MILYSLFIFIIAGIIVNYKTIKLSKFRKELYISMAIVLISTAYALDFYWNLNYLPNPGILLKKLTPLAKQLSFWLKLG